MTLGVALALILGLVVGFALGRLDQYLLDHHPNVANLIDELDEASLCAPATTVRHHKMDVALKASEYGTPTVQFGKSRATPRKTTGLTSAKRKQRPTP